jgi:hypothetical protein
MARIWPYVQEFSPTPTLFNWIVASISLTNKHAAGNARRNLWTFGYLKAVAAYLTVECAFLQRSTLLLHATDAVTGWGSGSGRRKERGGESLSSIHLNRLTGEFLLSSTLGTLGVAPRKFFCAIVSFLYLDRAEADTSDMMASFVRKRVRYSWNSMSGMTITVPRRDMVRGWLVTAYLTEKNNLVLTTALQEGWLPKQGVVKVYHKSTNVMNNQRTRFASGRNGPALKGEAISVKDKRKRGRVESLVARMTWYSVSWFETKDNRAETAKESDVMIKALREEKLSSGDQTNKSVRKNVCT